MTPIRLIPCRLSSEKFLNRRNNKHSVSNNGGNNIKRDNRNRNSGNNNRGNNRNDDDGDNDNHNSSSGNTHNSNTDDDDGHNNGGGGSSNGDNRFKFPSPPSSNGNGGSDSNDNSPFKFPPTTGSTSSSNGDTEGDKTSKTSSTRSSTSIIIVQSTTSPTTSTAQSSSTASSRDVSSISLSLTSTFTPSTTMSSSSVASSSSPEDAPMSQTPDSPNPRHVLPLGSIIAIILGILFCITIAGVVVVFTRPKFGNLARLWKRSRAPGRYLPSNSFEPMQQRDSSNMYRRYNPLERPQSRTFFDLQAFRFGSPGTNGIAQGSAVPQQPNNPVASNIASPSRKYDDFQTGHIYSTGMPTSSSAPVQPATRPMSNTSKQRTYTSISRIMSMIDAFSRERSSRTDSGQASFKSIEWKPPRNDPVSESRV